MSLTRAMLACGAATVGAYQAYLSMFVQRQPASIWLFSPVVPPVAYVLSGLVERNAILWLTLIVLAIGANAGMYALATYGVIAIALRVKSRISPNR